MLPGFTTTTTTTTTTIARGAHQLLRFVLPRVIFSRFLDKSASHKFSPRAIRSSTCINRCADNYRAAFPQHACGTSSSSSRSSSSTFSSTSSSFRKNSLRATTILYTKELWFPNPPPRPKAVFNASPRNKRSKKEKLWTRK